MRHGFIILVIGRKTAAQLTNSSSIYRAIAGWPLGDGKRHTNVVMQNLIGDEVKRVAELAKDENISLHLYGKTEIKPGRKMGHFNLVKEK